MENLSAPENSQIMSYKDWALTIFISSIPIIGFIMILIWAFGNEGNIHKQNWAKGFLLIWVIGFIIAMMFLFLFGGLAMLAALSN